MHLFFNGDIQEAMLRSGIQIAKHDIEFFVSLRRSNSQEWKYINNGLPYLLDDRSGTVVQIH